MATHDFNTFKQTVRDFLLADSALGALVGARVHFAYLASLLKPDGMAGAAATYPCVTLNVNEGRTPVPAVEQFTLVAGAHSLASYDEAHTVLKALDARFGAAAPGAGVVVTRQGTPGEVYDEEATLYSAYLRYSCHYLA